MSSPGGPTIRETEVINTVLPIVATLVTSFRLFERARQRRLWLDDAWATIAMLFNVILMIANWLYLNDFARLSQSTNIGLYYVIAQFFYATVWASRISILFTIIRLTVPGPLRTTMMFVFAAFVIEWMVLLAQVFWTCEAEPGWKSLPRPQCDLGRKVAIAQIITDVISDSILILAPVRLVYKVRLTRTQKIRIVSIFSTSAITTAVSLAHAYYVFIDGGLKEAVAAMFEASFSLIVANLNVVVAFLFRIGTEETATFTPNPIRSRITFGSAPIRKRVQRDPLLSTTVFGDESAVIKLDDAGKHPKEVGKQTTFDSETEGLFTRTVVQPEVSSDV